VLKAILHHSPVPVKLLYTLHSGTFATAEEGKTPSVEQRELLDRAKEHIITAVAVPDCATELAAINLSYGLAKIHHVQETLGYPADALFVASPDMTTPRGLTKWRWGLGAGGMLSWGDGSRPLAFLDLQISASTALVGGLSREPDLELTTTQIHRLRQSPPVVMGLEVGWGFGSGNHFINAYRVRPIVDDPLPPYVFVLHSGNGDVRRPSVLGIGLNYEKSKPLQELMKTIDTPLGPTRVLTGQAARDYYAMYLHYEEFVREKHLILGAEIFGEFTPISNETHHGLADANSALLGCCRFSADQRTIFPVTLRSDLPGYLVRGQPNIDSELLPCNHLPATIRRRVHTANILPHGGGFTYPRVRTVTDVLLLGQQRYYVLDSVGGGKRVAESLSTLMYTHRGFEVMDRLREWRLADIIAELQLLFSVTT
jgi:hypothetical protein